MDSHQEHARRLVQFRDGSSKKKKIIRGGHTTEYWHKRSDPPWQNLCDGERHIVETVCVNQSYLSRGSLDSEQTHIPVIRYAQMLRRPMKTFLADSLFRFCEGSRNFPDSFLLLFFPVFFSFYFLLIFSYSFAFIFLFLFHFVNNFWNRELSSRTFFVFKNISQISEHFWNSWIMNIFLIHGHFLNYWMFFKTMDIFFICEHFFQITTIY